jgi:hypothetical protein
MYLSWFSSVGEPASREEFEDCGILDLFQLLTKSVLTCRCFYYFPCILFGSTAKSNVITVSLSKPRISKKRNICKNHRISQGKLGVFYFSCEVKITMINLIVSEY